MNIKTQWDLWREINEERHFPQDHWDEKWISTKNEVDFLKSLRELTIEELIVEVESRISQLEGGWKCIKNGQR